MQRPIDLTTMGAVGEIPSASHAIFKGPISSACDIPSLEMPREQLVMKVLVLEGRVAALEQWIAQHQTEEKNENGNCI